MNSWEIERKLNDKVDKYELHNVNSEISRLRSKIDTLENNMQYKEYRINNLHEIVDRLIQTLISVEEDGVISVDTLYEIKNML